MKRNLSNIIWLAAALLCAGLVSCSKDNPASSLVEELPQGKYPLTLSASVDGTATRADGKDTWTAGDQIGVQLGDSSAEYVIGSNGSSLVPAGDGLYWQNTATATIVAWYPYSAAQTSIDISDQSGGYAGFDLLAATAEDQNYMSKTTLVFNHQMAKVSYSLVQGEGLTEEEFASATVQFAGYTQASFSDGALTGAADGWITPTSDGQVLLVPQNMNGKPFIKVSTSEGDYYYTPASDDEGNLQANCQKDYTVTVYAGSIEVNASVSGNTWTSEGSSTLNAGGSNTYLTEANGTRTYIVYDEAGLLEWAEYTTAGNWSTNCILAADIELTSNWTVIGDESNQYTGTFDGSGKTITGLTILYSSGSQGMFSYLGSTGKVKDLILDANVSKSGGDSPSNIGAVVGYNNGIVTGCTTTGSVSGGYRWVGGVVGRNSGIVSNCHNEGTVNCTEYAGGVVGINYGTVIGCYNTGEIYASNRYAGGVAGRNEGTITACYSTGAIGRTYSGGITGYLRSGSVIACYATGSVSGGNLGGIAGDATASQYSTCANCYWNNNATYCLGGHQSTEGVGKVDGSSVTWASAAADMNSVLDSKSWQFEVTNSDPPLKLVKQ